MVFNNTLILCWGSLDSNDGQSIDINFPITFTTFCKVGQASFYCYTGNHQYLNGIVFDYIPNNHTSGPYTGFTVMNRTNQTTKATWICIGY